MMHDTMWYTIAVKWDWWWIILSVFANFTIFNGKTTVFLLNEIPKRPKWDSKISY